DNCWTMYYTADGVNLWTRPDNSSGISATTSALATDRLHIFTTNAPPFVAGESYHKFAAYTLLHHGGDYAAAARDLLARGYGQPADHGAAARDQLDVILPGWRRQLQPPANPSSVTSATTPAGERLPLDVTNAALAADWLRTQLGRGPLAGMFNRSGQIVHTPAEGEHGYAATTDNDRDHDGPAQIRPVTASSLASRLTWIYRCHRTNADGQQKPALFPITAARVAVDVPDMLPHLRPLAGVTHTPLVRPDGTLLTQPGYDPETRLLHLPDPTLAVPPIPEQPTPRQVAAAVALLDEMTAGFPW